MSVTEYAKKALAFAASGLHALEAIGSAVRGIHGLPFSEAAYDKVMGVVGAIDAVVSVFERGLKGEVSHQEIDQATADLHKAFSDNDAAARARIDDRFPA